MARKKYFHQENQQLKDWFNSLPYNQRKGTREKIISLVKATDYKWSNWMSHKSRITELEQEKIEEWFDTEIFS